MNYRFVPHNLNPGTRQCSITVVCDTPLLKIHWYLYPNSCEGQVVGKNTILFNKNGLYTVELISPTETVKTNIKISHLKHAGGFAGGTGTKEDPYLIADCVQLNAIRLNLSAHYRLIKDLDLSIEMENLCWLPIGEYSQKEPKVESNIPYEDQDLSCQVEYGFTGEFDGNGYSITGLSCYHPRKKYIALFGSTGKGAFIHDITLNNCTFQDKSGEVVGTIVARSEDTVIEHCFVHNSVVLASTIGGGVVGGASSGTVIQMCQFSGEIRYTETISGKLGGIIGHSFAFEDLPIIQNCCVKANIFGGSYVAGIATGQVLITKCFFSGILYGSLFVAGILSTGELANVTNCICSSANLVYTTERLSSYKDSFWVTFSDEKGQETRSEFMHDIWKNHIGRILCSDHTLMPVKPGIQNFCGDSCRKSSPLEDKINVIEDSLRDGVTVPDCMLTDSIFYKKLGWDFDLVWEIGEDNQPTLRRKSKYHR